MNYIVNNVDPTIWRKEAGLLLLAHQHQNKDEQDQHLAEYRGSTGSIE